MANIFDYLDWRGDLPFSADPFNAVDNLILSEIAYTDLDGLIPGETSGGTVSLEEVSAAFFHLYSEEELAARKSFLRMMPFLMKKAAGTRRFRSMRIGRYVNRISQESEEQMAAMVFYPEEGLPYIAFRGTDNTIIGWKEDINLSFSAGTAGQQHAAAYLTDRLREIPTKVLVGGHSKGGNFAVYASAFCDPLLRPAIARVYSNDGPGFLEEIVNSGSYRAILPRVESIIPEGSVFGLLLNSGYPHTVVRSSEKGLFQHDGLSWQVLGKQFSTIPETSRISEFMEKTLQQWIGSFSLEERAAFSDALYDIMTSGGAGTLEDINRLTLAERLEMMHSFHRMDRQEKDTILTVFRQLLQSGVRTLQSEADKAAAQKPGRRKAGKAHEIDA